VQRERGKEKERERREQTERGEGREGVTTGTVRRSKEARSGWGERGR